MRGRRLLLWVLFFLLIFAGVAFATRGWWLVRIAEPLVSAEEPAKADLVVVLGGDLRGDRVIKAGNLVRDGFAPAALLSGEGYIYGEHESDYEVDFAKRRGFPAAYFIKFPFPASSTVEEVRAVAQELRRMKVHKILVVTSNFHTARAGRVFHREAPEFEVHMISATDIQLPLNDWWEYREARKVFFNEWLKTAAYRLGI